MHTCNTCGSCTNLDRNLAYLTDPPQYKCKESGRLHFQSDICDITQEDNEFWIDNGNQTGGQNMEDKEVRKAIRLLAAIIDKALGQTDCALSYKEWDMLRNLEDGNYGELDE